MTEDEIKKKTGTKELAEVKEESAKGKLEKVKEQIEIWDRYIGFVTLKIASCVAIVIGGLEFLYPNVLSAVIENPERLIGAGLALLGGGRVIEALIPFLPKIGGKK